MKRASVGIGALGLSLLLSACANRGDQANPAAVVMTSASAAATTTHCSAALVAKTHRGPLRRAGVPGSRALVAQLLELSGLDCANGGTRIDSGDDLNLNQVLDADEINATSYACRGAAGSEGAGASARTVLDVARELAGSNCPNGGERISTGRDQNQNQLLDPGEVVDVVYVCNAFDAPA